MLPVPKQKSAVHGEQTAAPPAAKKPAGHTIGAPVAAGQKDPEGHGMHVDDTCAPSTTLYVPAVHGVGVVMAAESQ